MRDCGVVLPLFPRIGIYKIALVWAFAIAFSGIAAASPALVIGGEEAPPDEFPATVQIRIDPVDPYEDVGYCTATKIGEYHFLTAAHCLADVSAASLTITATSARRSLLFRSKTLRIDSIALHPSYETYCHLDCEDGREPAYYQQQAADAAIVIVRSATPEIPVATVQTSSIPVGTIAIVTGYGCHSRNEDGMRHDLQMANAQIIQRSTPYLVTAGLLYDRAASARASLCLGDSGGPLYVRDASDEYVVVGVNSYVVYDTTADVASVKNYHALLDDSSDYRVGSWIYDTLAIAPVTIEEPGICGGIEGKAFPIGLVFGCMLAALCGLRIRQRQSRSHATTFAAISALCLGFCLPNAAQASLIGRGVVAVIGGIAVPAGMFPSTVQLRFDDHMIDFEVNLCTATKIGPYHFLTAAHCVTTEGLRTINIVGTTAERPFLYLAPKLKIDQIISHQTFTDHCLTNCTPPAGEEDNPYYSRQAADIAVVIVTEETPEIPIAPIADRMLEIGDEVVLAGYGCEARSEAGREHHDLRYQRSEITALRDPFLVTPGLLNENFSGTTASLCPGDSGGPLYVAEGESFAVAGVNSYVTFRDASTDTASYENYHTRLQGSELDDIALWLDGALAIDPVHKGEDAGCGALSGRPSAVWIIAGCFVCMFLIRQRRRH